MKITSVNNSINFKAAEDSNSSGSMSSSLVTTATNALTGVAVGAAVGGVRCIMPVSKKDVALKLSEALAVYGKEKVPVAREFSDLLVKYNKAVTNNTWLKYIDDIKNMPDDVFAQSSAKLASEVGLSSGKSLFSRKLPSDTFTKTQLIDAAKEKLIGKKPVIMTEDAINNLSESFSQKSAELLQHAEKMIKEDPKNELVKMAKSVAKKARNSGILGSSIRFGIIAAMFFGIFSAVRSAKSNKN